MRGYGSRYVPRAGYPYTWGAPVAPVFGYGFGVGRGRARGRGRGRGVGWRAPGGLPPGRIAPLRPAYYGMPCARGW